MDLIVRIVTLDAGVKSLPWHRILAGVAAFGNLLHDIFMAGRTLVRLKKIRYASIDINRVRVAPALTYLAVAVPARQLAVNGYVKALVIDQPRSIGGGRQPQQGKQ